MLIALRARKKGWWVLRFEMSERKRKSLRYAVIISFRPVMRCHKKAAVNKKSSQPLVSFLKITWHLASYFSPCNEVNFGRNVTSKLHKSTFSAIKWHFPHIGQYGKSFSFKQYFLSFCLYGKVQGLHINPFFPQLHVGLCYLNIFIVSRKIAKEKIFFNRNFFQWTTSNFPNFYFCELGTQC